jgi:hypothetical protein
MRDPSQPPPAGEPDDDRDLLTGLGLIHRLHLAPVGAVGRLGRLQHHPVVAGLKVRLEAQFLEDLAVRTEVWLGRSPTAGDRGAAAGIRTIVARDLVPPVYDWLAETATTEELTRFLAVEGGPDADFDDLVALCQIGLDGEPKLEMATNYWDEMGNGRAAAVHTTLYRGLVSALDLGSLDAADVPVEALRRATLMSVLATNRWLQPEMVGALGAVELQAGPRSRKVVAGLRRIGAGGQALAFYEEHAVADPRHGKAWLDRVVTPLACDPHWADGMVRGAAWRCVVNHELFSVLSEQAAVSAA